MKNIQGRTPWFIAISVGILSIAAIWGVATIHSQKRSIGATWQPLTSSEWTALFVHYRGRQKNSVFIGCSQADCSYLATSLVQVFERAGWSVGFGDAEDDTAVGIKIEPCLGEGAELWDAINSKTALHPVLACASSSTLPEQTRLVIGTKPPW